MNADHLLALSQDLFGGTFQALLLCIFFLYCFTSVNVMDTSQPTKADIKCFVLQS